MSMTGIRPAGMLQATRFAGQTPEQIKDEFARKLEQKGLDNASTYVDGRMVRDPDTQREQYKIFVMVSHQYNQVVQAVSELTQPVAENALAYKNIPVKIVSDPAISVFGFPGR